MNAFLFDYYPNWNLNIFRSDIRGGNRLYWTQIRVQIVLERK